MNKYEDIAAQYSPNVIEALAKRMEEMAQLPRDGSNPIRKPGERGKYEESHTPSAPSPKTHPRASLSDCEAL